MKASTSIGRVRLAGFIEGVSYITLLGIAMPLKYYADKPEYVRINGMIHGVLFIILCHHTFDTAFAPPEKGVSVSDDRRRSPRPPAVSRCVDAGD